MGGIQLNSRKLAAIVMQVIGRLGAFGVNVTHVAAVGPYRTADIDLWLRVGLSA